MEIPLNSLIDLERRWQLLLHGNQKNCYSLSEPLNPLTPKWQWIRQPKKREPQLMNNLSYSILILPVSPDTRTVFVDPFVLFRVMLPFSVAVELGEKVIIFPAKVVLYFTPVGNV